VVDQKVFKGGSIFEKLRPKKEKEKVSEVLKVLSAFLKLYLPVFSTPLNPSLDPPIVKYLPPVHLLGCDMCIFQKEKPMQSPCIRANIAQHSNLARSPF